MSSYSIRKPIPSCFVDKSTLAEIEKYIIQKGAEKYGLEIDDVKKKYKFTISDKYGEETFKSVNNFHRQQFPNDTKRLNLCLKIYSDTFLHICLDIGSDSYSSKIHLELDGENSRESATGILNEIERHLSENKNINSIFHGWLGGLFSALIGGSAFWTIWAVVKDENNFWSNSAVFIFLLSLSYFFIGRFSPYCTIDTQKNEQIKKTSKYILNGLAGVMLFGLIATYLRKTIFGI